MTAMGTPTTASSVGTGGIAYATTVGAAMTAMDTAKFAASAAWTAWCFGRGVVHTVHYLPPFLEEVHAPHSQSEAEEEKAMMGGFFVHAGYEGCVCWLCVCCTSLLFC
jgi:hypothetical protein